MEMQDQTKTSESGEHNITFSGVIIGYNKVLGHFDASMEYKVHRSEKEIDLTTINDEADLFESEDEGTSNPLSTLQYNDFVQYC